MNEMSAQGPSSENQAPSAPSSLPRGAPEKSPPADSAQTNVQRHSSHHGHSSGHHHHRGHRHGHGAHGGLSNAFWDSPLGEWLLSLAALSRTEALKKSAFALLTADLLFCPLALGGAPLWAVGISAALGWLALLLTALALEMGEHRCRMPILGSAAWGLLALLMLAQLVPLPTGLVRLLSPATAEAISAALTPLGLSPNFSPLTLDAPATARALLTTLSAFGAFAAAFQLAAVGGDRAKKKIAASLAISALTVALIGFGHWLTDVRVLFGAFKFSQASPPFLTPFGNPNHLAAFLALGAITASGLALHCDKPIRRCAWWLIHALIAIALILSLSRAGLAAFLVGQALFLTCHARFLSSDQNGESPPKAPIALAVSALGAAAVSGLYIASERLFREWEPLAQSSLSETKLSLAEKTLPLAARFWRFGTGKDAFESAFHSGLVLPGEGLKTFTHPENLAADWLVSFGLPLGILALLAFVLALVQALRTAGKSPWRWCALAAVFAAAADEFFNFALSFVGTAVPFAVLFAIASAHRHRGIAKVSAKRLLLFLMPALLFAGIAAFWSARHDMRSDGQALADLAQKSASRAEFVRTFEETALRHPLDYFPRLVASEAFLARRDADAALFMASQAMQLFPALPAPHAAAARALSSMDRASQAASEWLLAWKMGDKHAADVLIQMALAGQISGAFLTGMAFDAPQKAAELARRLTDKNALAEAETLLDALEIQLGGTAQKPTMSDAAALSGNQEDAGKVILQVQHLRASLFRRRGDAEGFLAAAQRLDETEARLGADRDTGSLLVAEALCQLKRCHEAAALLEERLMAKNSFALRHRLAQIFLSLGMTHDARNTLSDMPNALSLSQREALLRLDAAIAHRDGDQLRRTQALRTLASLRPASAEAALALAQALMDSGGPSLPEALSEVLRAERLIDKAPNASTNALRPLAEKARSLEAKIQQKQKAQRDEAMRQRFKLDAVNGQSAAETSSETSR